RLRSATLALAEASVPLSAAVAQLFLPRVTERVKKSKRRRGVFDFDDMLLLVDQALRGSGGELLRDLLRARYKYALIDEFQDTDEVQWRIFERLFFESGRRNVLYVVGDPKQAIYGFRGADVHTYIEAKGRMLHAGGAFVPLSRNHRSTGRLIDAV